jgi:hypothetical protein
MVAASNDAAHASLRRTGPFFCVRVISTNTWQVIQWVFLPVRWFLSVLGIDLLVWDVETWWQSHNPAKSNRGSSQQIWWFNSGMGNHPKKTQRGTGRRDFPAMLEAPGLPLTLIQPEIEVVDTRWCPRLRKRVQLVN